VGPVLAALESARGPQQARLEPPGQPRKLRRPLAPLEQAPEF